MTSTTKRAPVAANDGSAENTTGRAGSVLPTIASDTSMVLLVSETDPPELRAQLDHLDDTSAHVLTHDQAARYLDGRHALIVVSRTENGFVRRRCYLSLSAADRAADRARDRGHSAMVVLVRLTPAGILGSAA